MSNENSCYSQKLKTLENCLFVVIILIFGDNPDCFLKLFNPPYIPLPLRAQVRSREYSGICTLLTLAIGTQSKSGQNNKKCVC